jgi:hypothetical protein
LPQDSRLPRISPTGAGIVLAHILDRLLVVFRRQLALLIVSAAYDVSRAVCSHKPDS